MTTKKLLRETKRTLIGCLIVLVLFSPIIIAWGSFFRSERLAIKGKLELDQWTQAECEEMWDFAVAECQATSESRRILTADELPEILTKIGFEKAKVTSDEFEASLGGSSHGTYPATVICFLNEPRMIFGMTFYDPKTKLISSRRDVEFE